MLDQSGLETGLERLRAQLEKNILERSEDEPSIAADLKHRYETAKAAKRTGLAFELWRENEITQAAVAWLLGCVFVRFLEDNELIEQPWISGPGERVEQAKKHNLETYRAGLHRTDRDYLLLCFNEIGQLPGVSGLFDKSHNPLYRLSPTGHGARALIDFFQRTNEDGSLLFDFTGTIDDTRFLGDLYQNISESARKRYALVQTPDFVVDFILDRTMTPALEEFGLDGFRIIDPACGSGHFLLAAFERLFYRWQRYAPDLGPLEHANRALASVFGVDLNPFAIAIARFRLLIAALRVCEVKRLRDNFDFKTNLAIGDSLLHGERPRDTRAVQSHAFDTSQDFYYETEDKDKLRMYLSQQYHAVVANPPYITVSDPILRERYRDLFGSASGKYQLSVPFMERCFDLAEYGDRPGSVGMITSNAFVKRSFGRTLIEKFLPNWDITHVIDTSGSFIPGHATPTVILLGRCRPASTEPVRVVRGIRGELREPADPARGAVWRAIVTQIDSPGSQSRWVSVADVGRQTFHHHPWSMGGGGAAEIKEQLDDNAATVVRKIVTDIGVFGMTNADDAMIAQASDFARKGLGREVLEDISSGDDVRDWCVHPSSTVLFPYTTELLKIETVPKLLQWLWPCRSTLWARATFNGGNYRTEGRPWYQWHQVSLSRRGTYLIAFGEIATHNNFALHRGCGIFKQAAPVIKLAPQAGESDYVDLLGILNSSAAGFWLRQICYDKGSGGNGRGISTERWEHQHSYDSSKVGQVPLPSGRPVELAAVIQTAADERTSLLTANLIRQISPTRKCLGEAQERAKSLLRRMIALQEELDWQVYFLYGLTEDSITLPMDQIPKIELGQRAFEIVMARQMAEGELETEWFNRHGSMPITEIPSDWPEPYRQLVQKRLEIIATDRDIALIEQPEYKRRWNLPKWEDLETDALRNWLLDRLEDARYWPTNPPPLRTVANLAAVAAEDDDFMQVAELYSHRSDFKVEALVTELVEKESIPFLPVLRYKPSGLMKRKLWEETWALQRREDTGETLEIPVPPKYDKADFLSDTGWRLRGKLDVPKERWISYPHLETDADSSLPIGWAGYDHAQQAIALATYYQTARDDGWPPSRLIPILAGIQELLPWVLQWHNQPDATGTGAGDFIAEFLRNELSRLNLTENDVRGWTPPAQVRKPAKRGSRNATPTGVEVTQ